MTARVRSVCALILYVSLGAIIVSIPFVTPQSSWLPRADEAGTLLATLLTAQAAIAALTLAVTLFVMQGVSVRRDADDRMYREYVRQSRVRGIFRSSISAVGITGIVFLAQEFISRVEMAECIVPGLGNLTLVAALAFFANLVFSGILFEQALRLAHPERWLTLRRNVNERDVREAVQAFLSRNRRAAVSLETNRPDVSVILPDPGEGSADEAIRALIDDALRAMAESRFREFRQSLESIKGLITYAMDEIEDEGLPWRLPGSQPEWPPLKELSRYLYSFREAVIHEGNSECVTGLLGLNYWMMSTGVRRRVGDLFTAGLEGYRSNYQIASRSPGEEFREDFSDRVWVNTPSSITGEESEEMFPYAQEMIRLQGRLLSDAMHNDKPGDFERMHRRCEAALRLNPEDWESSSWSSVEMVERWGRLGQEYRIMLMGLAGRAINLAKSDRLADLARYLEVGRAVHDRGDRLADDISQALVRDDSFGAKQWLEWEWEGVEPGKAKIMRPEQYPLSFFVVRLMELSSNTMPALDLRGSANRVLGCFETNAERLLPFVAEEPTGTKEERRVWAAGALRASVQADETAEEDRIVSSSLSPERVSLFKSAVHASAFAINSVEQLFDQAGAFLYLPSDTNAGPEERRYPPKALFAELPAGSPQNDVLHKGDRIGRHLAEEIRIQLCEALDGSPEISVPLDTPEELLYAFEMAKNELDPSVEVAAVLAGNWMRMESALNSEKPEGYVPAWQLPDAARDAELGRYLDQTLLRGPRDGELRLYLVEPRSWGSFVRTKYQGDQDLRIEVNTISAERARELLTENPNPFSSEPNETSKLRKLQTLVELEVYARVEFRVKDPSRARRVVQSGVSTAPAPQ